MKIYLLTTTRVTTRGRESRVPGESRRRLRARCGGQRRPFCDFIDGGEARSALSSHEEFQFHRDVLAASKIYDTSPRGRKRRDPLLSLSIFFLPSVDDRVRPRVLSLWRKHIASIDLTVN